MIAFGYFISFMLMVSLIFLNLFIAIILEGFAQSEQEQSIRISRDHIELFQKLWTKYDPDATGFIPVKCLRDLVLDLTYEEVLLKESSREDENSKVIFNFSSN